jgi:hypothetical protein
MRVLSAAISTFVLSLVVPVSEAFAERRLALLIGNQGYSDKVGRLKNPHNDIALVDSVLRKLGFKTTLVGDAGYKAMDTALRSYIKEVRRAGKETISFLYYAGHGAAEPDTQVNYLIPVDVPSADDAELWTNSLELRAVVNRLREQSPNATHFVVFDACRNELNLTRDGKRALVDRGFVPVSNIAGVMIAYATAPGQTASDAGEVSGPYAKALAEEIAKPGIESVMMFRNVQLKVKQAIGQDPWLSFPTLPAVYFAGIKPAAPTKDQQLELTFWTSVKDSTSPIVLGTYLDRYPKGEFAPIARALIDHYERKLEAEQAEREEERKLKEEASKAAAVKRLEDERRAREAKLAEDRRRAEETKNTAEAKRLEERQRAELMARTEELRKALEEARLAREAAKAAEAQRLAALKAAEKATSQAEQAIAAKRDAERHSEPAKVAALPKLEKPSAGSFDGTWSVYREGPGCKGRPRARNLIVVTNGVVSGRGPIGPITGSVSGTGQLRFGHASHTGDGKTPDGFKLSFQGTLRGSGGSGTFQHTRTGTRCHGTFTATRG